MVETFSIPSPYKWDSSFDVKHDELNGQHQKLFELIADLEKDQSNGTKLKNLLDMVVLHFKTEEEIQTKKGLLSDEHKEKHENLLKDCANVKHVDQGVIDFLKGWLVRHIKGSDIPDYGGRV